jgi:hypothetical protein
MRVLRLPVMQFASAQSLDGMLELDGLAGVPTTSDDRFFPCRLMIRSDCKNNRTSTATLPPIPLLQIPRLRQVRLPHRCHGADWRLCGRRAHEDVELIQEAGLDPTAFVKDRHASSTAEKTRGELSCPEAAQRTFWSNLVERQGFFPPRHFKHLN